MKPLDCIDIDPARTEVGKHDFVLSPTEPIVHGPARINDEKISVETLSTVNQPEVE